MKRGKFIPFYKNRILIYSSTFKLFIKKLQYKCSRLAAKWFGN